MDSNEQNSKDEDSHEQKSKDEDNEDQQNQDKPQTVVENSTDLSDKADVN